MKNRLLFLVITVGALFAGCSDDEENLSPSNIDRNRYAAADFSTPEEMEIRNQFYENTGCYLVFTDSLTKREAVTPAGTYVFVDTIDLNYAASYRTNEDFDYSLLPKSIDMRREAADFLEDEVLPRLDTVFYPYSFFIVDTLIVDRHHVDYGMEEVGPELMGSWVCYSTTIVGCNGLFEMDAAEREAQIREVQKGILINKYSTALDSINYLNFIAISDPYRYIDETWRDEGKEKWEWAFERGFLYGVWSTQAYRNWDTDVAAYIWEMFSMTREEFDEKYGQWDIILQRRDALVKDFSENNVRVY